LLKSPQGLNHPWLSFKKEKIMNTPLISTPLPRPAPRLLYPSLIVAATSVTVFSLLGIAGLSGNFPSSNASTNSSTNASTNGTTNTRASPDVSQSLTPDVEKRGSRTCLQCGVVESVSAVEVKGSASGLGVVLGGVTGAVLGNTMGSGNGRTAMTLVGGGAGAFAGNEIEKNSNRRLVWRTTVRMDTGAIQTYTLRHQPLAVGAKVQLINGQPVPRA